MRPLGDIHSSPPAAGIECWPGCPDSERTHLPVDRPSPISSKGRPLRGGWHLPLVDRHTRGLRGTLPAGSSPRCRQQRAAPLTQRLSALTQPLTNRMVEPYGGRVYAHRSSTTTPLRGNTPVPFWRPGLPEPRLFRTRTPPAPFPHGEWRLVPAQVLSAGLVLGRYGRRCPSEPVPLCLCLNGVGVCGQVGDP
jgi:hypothetical protein